MMCVVQMIRKAIAQHTGVQLPEVPAAPTYIVPESVSLQRRTLLLPAVDMLGQARLSTRALPAEEYGMRYVHHDCIGT